MFKGMSIVAIRGIVEIDIKNKHFLSTSGLYNYGYFLNFVPL
jgi:hypothetical protein